VGSICLKAYRHVQGHALRRPYGWQGFWPDPGHEQARYADKVICGVVLYPRLGPLGRGRHVRWMAGASTRPVLVGENMFTERRIDS